MNQFFRKEARRAFTLVELLIVIGILAVLGTAAVIVINPAELMKQTRDATRVSDLETLNKALSMYQAEGGSSFGTINTVYISLPDANANCSSYTLPTLPGGWSYACKPTVSYRSTDGSGWLPVNLASISSGSPLATLPIDPVNDATAGEYYAYVGGSWELTAPMESGKYKTSQAAVDGGTSIASFEIGPDLLLTPSVVEEYKRDDSLVGYWTFDETSGSVAADSSGSGNNATLVNGPTWGTGVRNGGLVFDGVNDHVSAGTGAGLKVDSKSFSVCAWIKPASEISIGGRYTVMNTYSPGWIVDLPDDGGSEGYRFYNGSSAYKYVPTGGTVSLDWTHIVVTRDTSTNQVKMYLNGELKQTFSVSSVTASNNPLYIGRRTDGYYFNGIMDDVRLYSRALTATEVQALYATHE